MNILKIMLITCFASLNSFAQEPQDLDAIYSIYGGVSLESCNSNHLKLVPASSVSDAKCDFVNKEDLLCNLRNKAKKLSLKASTNATLPVDRIGISHTDAIFLLEIERAKLDLENTNTLISRVESATSSKIEMVPSQVYVESIMDHNPNYMYVCQPNL